MSGGCETMRFLKMTTTLPEKALTFLLECNFTFLCLYSLNFLIQKHGHQTAVQSTLQTQILFVIALVALVQSPFADHKTVGEATIGAFIGSIAVLLMLYAFCGSVYSGTFIFLLVAPALSTALTFALTHEARK